MKAPASARSNGTLNIAFGLVNVVVSVYTGVDEESRKVKRSMRSPSGNPVNFRKVDAVTGVTLTQDEINMVYTCTDGTEVSLNDAEIEKALDVEKDAAEVVGFYPLDQADRYVTSSMSYVAPKVVNKKRPNDKPFALLMGAMKAEGVFALLSYVSRGKPRLGVLLPDGTLRVVFWENEVREAPEVPDAPVLTDQEKGMAAMLVANMTEAEAPALANESVEAVREYAETKGAGQEKPGPVQVTETGPTAVDLIALLNASVEAAKGAKAVAS